MSEDILRYFVPAISVIVTYLLNKLTKHEIDKSQIEKILNIIIDIIYDVEKTNNRSGEQKKAEVSRTVFRILSTKQLKLVKKFFGSVDNAVEVAFRRTKLHNP
jgi:hypothetical protein